MTCVLFSSENVPKEYVFHPINAYHLLKRTSIYLPTIFKQMPKQIDQFIKFNVTSLPYELTRASHGIADLLEFYNFNAVDLMKGKLIDKTTGNIYKSNSPLASRELFQIAEEAKKVYYYEGYIKLLDSSLKIANTENQTVKYMKNLR